MGEYCETFITFDIAQDEARGSSGRRRPHGQSSVSRRDRPQASGDRANDQKLGKRYNQLHVCFEAGRQVRDLGHDCMVVAPALVPKRAGERSKTKRRDAVKLATASGGQINRALGAGSAVRRILTRNEAKPVPVAVQKSFV